MTEPTNAIELILQQNIDGSLPVGSDTLQGLLSEWFPELSGKSLLVRITTDEEMRELNAQFRGLDKATDVLSFPYEPLLDDDADHLGDLAMGLPLILAEARELNRTPADHFTHLLCHGVLHLLGFDHEEEAEATQMQSREVELLARVGVANPYM